MLNIRCATLTDVPALHSLIQEMSEYEHLPFSITEQILASDGFGVQPRFRAMIAEFDDQPAGYAFFESYSTFQGRGLFLEDLFVRPQFRKNQIGWALCHASPGWPNKRGVSE
jgi:GNAT superfamily N-acetyltransferase